MHIRVDPSANRRKGDFLGSLSRVMCLRLTDARLSGILASAAQDGSLSRALASTKEPEMEDDEKAGSAGIASRNRFLCAYPCPLLKW